MIRSKPCRQDLDGYCASGGRVPIRPLSSDEAVKAYAYDYITASNTQCRARALRYCNQPGCPERVERGRCKAHQRTNNKAKDQYRGTATERGYDAGWRKLRAMYLASNPLCVDCLEAKRITVATDGHHVAKVADAPHMRLDYNNLMALCHRCHAGRTARGE